MDKKELTETSKFVSYVLRHEPHAIGLELDDEGWAEVQELFDKTVASGRALDMEILQAVMTMKDKKRFELSSDGQRIRAIHGHSADGVKVQYEPAEPPPVLYHGTATRFLDSIRAKGILPGERHLVHMSADRETAVHVGQRHGKVVVLEVDAAAMRRKGHEFYRVENGIWLVKEVPAEFIAFP